MVLPSQSTTIMRVYSVHFMHGSRLSAKQCILLGLFLKNAKMTGLHHES